MLMTFCVVGKMAPRKGKKGVNITMAALKVSKSSTPNDIQIPDGVTRLPHNMGPIVKSIKAEQGQTTDLGSDGQLTAVPKTRYALRSRNKSSSNQTESKQSLGASIIQDGGVNRDAQVKRPTTKRQMKEIAIYGASQRTEPYQDSRSIAVRKQSVPKQKRSPYQTYTSVPWGETPWPELGFPSTADCQRVYAILSSEHANGNLNFQRPAKIPPPSLSIAGCGETQLILDGLIRTILSGSTTFKNANSATESIVDFYGTVTKSITINGEEVTPVEGVIDWNKVRLLGVDDFRNRIRSAGLQDVNSKAIIAILEKTYGLNLERTMAFKQEKATGIPADVPGAEKLTQNQKDMEIWMFENDVISLEHLRSLSSEEVMNELIQFEGVGVKTAACVLLFGLQEPCFAVDTHCFRMAKWLGWLPKDVKSEGSRDKACAHLDVRIPDHLKYGLHQLFIEHGQNCYRCKTNTREGSTA